MLSQPTVVGPITPCTRKVRVKNQVTGARVQLFADGAPVGSDIAGRPDAFIPLDAGVQLRTRQQITAVQSAPGPLGLESKHSPDPVLVLTTPTAAALGKLDSAAQPVECGTCILLRSVEPGATVTVEPSSRPTVTVEADWAVERVGIPNGLTATGPVRMQQTACGIPGPVVSLATPLRQNPVGPPPDPPTIDEPLTDCQQSIYLRGIRPGATVLLDRGGGEVPICFGGTEGSVWLDAPLEFGEVLAVRQEYTADPCRLIGGPRHVRVTERVPNAPWFPYPVCAGDPFVMVGGLRPGATVHVFRDEHPDPIGVAGADAPVSRINLTSGWTAQRLSARQLLCRYGPWSDAGETRVIPRGDRISPIIVEPLHECAIAVAVTGLPRGAFVRIVSKLRGGRIGETTASGDTFEDVQLWLALEAGDEISVETLRCGILGRPGRPAIVQRVPERLPAPILRARVDDCGGSVPVSDLIPGAIVDIEIVNSMQADPDVAGSLIASVPATRREMPISVPPIPPGTMIRARQRLCRRRSEPSAVARVEDLGLVYDPTPTFRTVRVCQLTGASDPVNRPHPFDTTGIDLIGTDLGIPVEHQGRLWLFFGDCDEGEESDPDGDPIAWTTDDPEPDAPGLRWMLNEDGLFRRLVVEGLRHLGNFEVPTGGFGYDGRLYLFVATDKTDETIGGKRVERMNTSHLAVTKPPAHDPNQNLFRLYEVSSTLPAHTSPAGPWLIHVSPVVVRNADWPRLPSSVGDGLLLFGTGLYRQTDAYLAWAPLTPGQHPPRPDTWWFFTSLWAGDPRLPLWHHLIAGVPPRPLVGTTLPGELSVSWSPRLRRWLMIYGHGLLRTARYPWGPWTNPIVVFDGNDVLRSADNIQSGGRKVYVGLPHALRPGGLTGTYAPYLIPRWTHYDRSTRIVKIYYTLSTEHPPYQVQLMRSTLRCGEQ